MTDKSLVRTFAVLFLFLILLNVSVWAKDVIGLATFQPNPGSPRIVVPMLEGETGQKSVERYLKEFYKNEDMQDLIRRSDVKKSWLKAENIVVLDHRRMRNTFMVNFLFMANDGTDFRPNDFRVNTFFKPVSLHGGNPYLLPIAHDLGLTPVEARAYRELLSETFDVLFGMGGDDVHPRLYGQRITHANAEDLNFTRDKSEIRMIRHWNDKAKGVYYGVCRGEQICAVERGEKLIQDLGKEGIDDPHWDVWHKVKLIKNGEKDANLLAAFVNFKDEIDIASFHHQAVVVPGKDSVVDVIADHGEGSKRVVEAIQFKNQLGLGLQFHPELMNTEDGDLILKGMVEYSRFVKRLRMANYPCSNYIELFIRSR